MRRARRAAGWWRSAPRWTARAAGPGTRATMTAANTTIQAGAQVSANATAKGDGGRVVVLSGKGTSMAGAITAKGGPNGGDGGFVEVSGGAISLSGQVDTSAPQGARGTLLLDPLDLWVSDVQP